MSKLDIKDDILKELFNISVGKAADMLSEIIDKKIILNVPNVEFINARETEMKLKKSVPKVLNGTLMVSSISFEKSLTGKANLIFPAEKVRTFINLCLHKKDNIYEIDFTDVDFDIIKEVGNIILNCIIGSIGNLLSINLTYALPKVKVFKKIDFSKDIEKNENSNILLLYITFIIDDTEIEGAIIINLTFNSVNKLMKKINKIEDELYE